MTTHRPNTRWPTPWPALPAAGRRPVPTAEIVAAAPLLAALLDVLDGQRPPCAGDPELWTSDDPDDVAVAVEGCAPCPARRQCAAYADAIGATVGTWAGRDRTSQDRRRPSTNTEMEHSA